MADTVRDTAARFTGVGFAFPFNVTETGGIGKARGSDLIGHSLLQIFQTKIGERIMRRDFGTAHQELTFEINNPNIDRLLYASFTDAVRRWERRIEITEFHVIRDDQTPELLFIEFSWQQVDSQREGNLVFPYYLGGGGV